MSEEEIKDKALTFQSIILESTYQENKMLLGEVKHLKEQVQRATNQSLADHKYASQKEDEAIILQEKIKNAIKEITYTKKILKNTAYMLSKRDLLKELENYLEILGGVDNE